MKLFSTFHDEAGIWALWPVVFVSHHHTGGLNGYQRSWQLDCWIGKWVFSIFIDY